LGAGSKGRFFIAKHLISSKKDVNFREKMNNSKIIVKFYQKCAKRIVDREF